MKKCWFVLLLALCIQQTGWGNPPLRLSEYVSPLVGTQSDITFSTGNTYPAIALPWGMNFWTPQTGRMGDGWAYTYGAHTIRGFKQTHQPSPWINDYGQFSLMPVRGRDKLDEESRQSWFSHMGEEVHPYYYRVYLADSDVRVEITPTDRAAMMRFTFPDSEGKCENGVVVDGFDGGSEIRVVDEYTVVGYTSRNSGGVPANFRNYFVIRFDKSIAEVDNRYDTPRRHALCGLYFATKRGEQVTARVASSFISEEQAFRNLQEVGEYSFETIRDRAQARWDEVLGRFEVEGGSVEQRRTFYSCLYRATLFPRKFYELDATGAPIHYSPYNGQVLPGYLYTDTGFWDTFRSLFPLLNLIYPSENHKIQAGLANVYRESGFLPEWASPGHRHCMVGTNSASVVSDAIVKGITPKEDIETLYKAMLNGRNQVHPQIPSTGRLGHEYYNRLGYVPYNVSINENVARTLEYAYNDWCTAQVAHLLGKQEDAVMLEKASQNWKNLFDKSTRLMRGRNEDGTFQTPFNPYKWGDAYTEGNAWHYTWSVFHDVEGLADAMGGDSSFVEMLDSVFVVPPIYDDSYYGVRIHEITEMQVADMGNYAHGNQPAQHMIYLYNYTSEPWKAQWWTREVMNRLYRATPDGYCGDEDNGQTSAWYVFSAMGFYPVCPTSNQYVVGSPLFEGMTIHLEDGNTIEIEARNNSDRNRYIGSMSLNGKRYEKNYVCYSDLKQGAKLLFKMQDTPAKQSATTPSARPYSFSRQ